MLRPLTTLIVCLTSPPPPRPAGPLLPPALGGRRLLASGSLQGEEGGRLADSERAPCPGIRGWFAGCSAQAAASNSIRARCHAAGRPAARGSGWGPPRGWSPTEGLPGPPGDARMSPGSPPAPSGRGPRVPPRPSPGARRAGASGWHRPSGSCLPAVLGGGSRASPLIPASSSSSSLPSPLQPPAAPQLPPSPTAALAPLLPHHAEP